MSEPAAEAPGTFPAIVPGARSKFGWRLLFIAGFLPLGLPVVLWSFGTIVAASAAWLVRGARDDGEDRLERWAFGRVGRTLDWPLDQLMRKADVLRELWAKP